MLIKRILIISNGIPIFDYEDFAKQNDVLVGGLITALTQFTEETEKETISRVLLEESQFILKKIDNLIFVLQILDEMPDEYAELVLSIIIKHFLANFKDDAINCPEQSSKFVKFQEICKNILANIGFDIVNLLMQKKDDYLCSWAIYDNTKKAKALFVTTSKPNYNIDTFTIMHVLSKNSRKIVNNLYTEHVSVLFHISHSGDVFNTILLPYITIAEHYKLSDFKDVNLKKFKIFTQKQLSNIIEQTFSPFTENYTFSIIKKAEITDEEESNDSNKKENKHQNYLKLIDLLNSSSQGFKYLFNKSGLVQIISSTESANLIIDLVTRYIVINFNEHLDSSSLIKGAFQILSSDITS